MDELYDCEALSARSFQFVLHAQAGLLYGWHALFHIHDFDASFAVGFQRLDPKLLNYPILKKNRTACIATEQNSCVRPHGNLEIHLFWMS